jgi:energy-coupling factor transport system permease protein
MKTILGLLDKLLFPFKVIKVPVQDYLKVVMCIVMELKGTGEEMKTSFLNHARSVLGGSNGSIRSKFNGISQIIVSLLVDSFQKLDKLENFVEKINPEELFHYKFKITKREIIALLSIVLLLLVINFIEKGNGIVLCRSLNSYYT